MGAGITRAPQWRTTHKTAETAQPTRHEQTLWESAPRPVSSRATARRRTSTSQADAPLLVIATGHVLHATLNRSVVARGRRIHDLLHPAAHLRLARGVGPSTGLA